MTIPYGRQSIDEDDIAAVVEVLRGDWLTQGPTVERFEDAIAEYVGAKYAVAFSSGTAALHGAAFAAGWGSGDVVYTSPLTFIASANCIRYVGATPALVDIRPDTWNLDLAQIPADAAGVVAVHYAGLPVDLANPGWEKRPPVVIEDAAHALGARTPDGPVGNCAHSDMCCFSFHPVKPITTGEGGMVTTNDEGLAEALRTFRSHGIVRMPEKGRWFYQVQGEGYNYRLTDIQAALGISQLRKLDGFIDSRNEIACSYRRELSRLPVALPPEAPSGFLHGYHLFPVAVGSRGKVFAQLANSGIRAQVHYVPVHHHRFMNDVLCEGVGFPNCDDLYSRLVSLPVFPDLLGVEVKRVIGCLRESVCSDG